MKTTSVADANRHFSSLPRDVTAGTTTSILYRDKPAPTMLLAQTTHVASRQARARLLDRLRQQTAQPTARNWTRDELYVVTR